MTPLKHMLLPGLVAIAIAPGVASGAERIGRFVFLDPDVFGTAPGESQRELERKGPVFLEDRLESRQNAGGFMKMRDDSKIWLGANSVLVLDEFLYKGHKRAARKMTVEISLGVMRFVSGNIRKRQYQVRTPVANIGIRGTDFVVEVEPDGTTTVWVLRGRVTVTALADGSSAKADLMDPVRVTPAGEATRIKGRRNPVPNDPNLEIPGTFVDGGAHGDSARTEGGTGGGHGD